VSVTGVSGSEITVTVDGVQTTVPAGEEASFESWHFQGFSSPVDNPPVLNVTKAGSGVPLKWRLADDAGVACARQRDAPQTIDADRLLGGIENRLGIDVPRRKRLSRREQEEEDQKRGFHRFLPGAKRGDSIP